MREVKYPSKTMSREGSIILMEPILVVILGNGHAEQGFLSDGVEKLHCS